MKLKRMPVRKYFEGRNYAESCRKQIPCVWIEKRRKYADIGLELSSIETNDRETSPSGVCKIEELELLEIIYGDHPAINYNGVEDSVMHSEMDAVYIRDVPIKKAEESLSLLFEFGMKIKKKRIKEISQRGGRSE